MNGFSELLLFTSLHASLWALVKSLEEGKPSEKQPCLVLGLESDEERPKWRFALTGSHMLQDFIFFFFPNCVLFPNLFRWFRERKMRNSRSNRGQGQLTDTAC